MDMKSFYKMISFDFNPLGATIPLLQLIIFMTDRTLGFTYLAQAILLQSIIPILLTLLLIQFKAIDDLDLTERSSRYKILFPITFLFLIAFLLSPNANTLTVNLGLFLGMLAFTFINLRWKISGHMILDAIIWVKLVSLINPFFIIAFIYLPLVAYSRVYLKKHTGKQVVAGLILGLVIGVGVLVLRGIRY